MRLLFTGQSVAPFTLRRLLQTAGPEQGDHRTTLGVAQPSFPRRREPRGGVPQLRNRRTSATPLSRARIRGSRLIRSSWPFNKVRQ